jgi:hypothetical protein
MNKNYYRMNRKNVIVLLIIAVIFSSCWRNNTGQGQSDPTMGNQVFEVIEVLQASQYTYLQVKEGSEIRWVAVTQQKISAGEVYYYDKALEMNDFHSKELDKTFDAIYFVNQISKTPLKQGLIESKSPHTGKVQTEKDSNITLEKQDQEITIAQIFGNPSSFTEKEFEIRGIVVKVNQSILGKNWIHIQDGTGSNGNFDLTITSQDLAELNSEVTFSGKISLNRDFGAGYVYDVIMEDATLVSSKW